MMDQMNVSGTEQNILEVARELLARGGLPMLSMRAVADQAGISATAIYHYYANKQDLVNRVVEQGFRRFDEYLLKAINGQPDGSFEQLTVLAKAYVHFAFENEQYFRVLFNVEATPQAQLENIPGHAGYRLFRECIVAGINRGTIRDADPDMIAIYLWCLIHGLVSLSMTGRIHGSPVDDGSIENSIESRFMDQLATFIKAGVQAKNSGSPVLADKENMGADKSSTPNKIKMGSR